jgi:hypothetical protein
MLVDEAPENSHHKDAALSVMDLVSILANWSEQFEFRLGRNAMLPGNNCKPL